MIRDGQTLIKTRDLARVLGVGTATLYRWQHDDKRVKACIFRRGWFSVALLREHKLLTAPSEHVQNH